MCESIDISIVLCLNLITNKSVLNNYIIYFCTKVKLLMRIGGENTILLIKRIKKKGDKRMNEVFTVKEVAEYLHCS